MAKNTEQRNEPWPAAILAGCARPLALHKRAWSLLVETVRRRTFRWSLTLVRERGELPHVLNERRLFGCAAEIGVWRGYFSHRLLGKWKGAHLLSIDPWTAAPQNEYVDLANVTQAEHDRNYEATRAKLARYGSRSSVWRMSSARAAANVPPHSLDFVYIDARHDFDSVKEDLALWYGRVRPGGILAGHDYLDGELPGGRFGVKRAVDEFCQEHDLRLHVTDEGPLSSWVVEMPELPVSPRLSPDAVEAKGRASESHPRRP